jgi:hypothetical protein
MEKLGKTKSFDVTVKHHMKGPRNSFGEKIGGMTATFTQTFLTRTKKRAIEKMETYCKSMGIDVIEIREPIERP